MYVTFVFTFLFIQEERKNFLGQEHLALLPMPSTPQRNSQTASMLNSAESQHNDEDEQLFEVPCVAI